MGTFDFQICNSRMHKWKIKDSIYIYTQKASAGITRANSVNQYQVNQDPTGVYIELNWLPDIHRDLKHFYIQMRNMVFA